MIKFIIVRHGYSVANKDKRFCGQNDVPLDETGYLQAEDVSEYIKDNFHVDAIYSSDLKRAYDTVKPLSDAIGVPIICHEGFREINVGDWRGLTLDEAAKKFPETYEKYMTNPWASKFEGGESYADVTKRAMAALDEIITKQKNGTVVIATHGGVVSTILAAAKNSPEVSHVANASISVIEYSDEGKWSVSVVGYCDFLKTQTPNMWAR